jgi:hypothetical protein
MKRMTTAVAVLGKMEAARARALRVGERAVEWSAARECLEGGAGSVRVRIFPSACDEFHGPDTEKGGRTPCQVARSSKIRASFRLRRLRHRRRSVRETAHRKASADSCPTLCAKSESASTFLQSAIPRLIRAEPARQIWWYAHMTSVETKFARSSAQRGQRELPLLHCVDRVEENSSEETHRTQRLEQAGRRPLRFFLDTSNADLREFRVSAIFESHPQVDFIVIGVAKNGFTHVGDLHGAYMKDVFAGVDSRLDEKRWFIERLQGHVRLRLGY